MATIVGPELCWTCRQWVTTISYSIGIVGACCLFVGEGSKFVSELPRLTLLSSASQLVSSPDPTTHARGNGSGDIGAFSG